MIVSEKYKAYLIGGSSLVAIFLLLWLTGEIVLPFVLAIFIAYLLNPVILRIQRILKNRNLAITSFLIGVTALFIGGSVLFGGYIVKDTKRLVAAVGVFADENGQQIEELKESLSGFADQVYESEALQNQIAGLDSLSSEEEGQDLLSAIGSVYSFFEDPDSNEDHSPSESWSFLYMLIYTVLYTVFILFTYDYFEEKYVTYVGDKKLENKRLAGIWSDFDTVFLIYFRQRAKVVLINVIIFVIAFTIMDLPGAILIGLISGTLSYASHFHYLSLPLVGIGCWVLSMEHSTSFFLYFGILLLVFILISILEETLYFNRIMNSVNGMNPAIVLLAFALWIYVFGGFTGTIIALPLTQLIMIYLDRLLMDSAEIPTPTG